MARAVDPKATWDYVLMDDRELPADQQTTWRLRPLSERAWRQIADCNPEESPGTAAYLILKAGLATVENYFDHQGNPLRAEMSGGQVSDKFLSLIHQDDRQELVQEISSNAQAKEAERD